MKDLIVDTWRRLSALDRAIVAFNLLVGAWNLGAASPSIGFMSLCIALLYTVAMSNLHRVKEQAEVIEALVRTATTRGGSA
ncbi:hypothetical protein [Prescottella equi]|uniref:Uncharacterized protein n=1 Tax=Rhodococcus phage REQ2 TaxID=1109713 RepID=G9FGZ0_9CAUD|nr:hypothetical protein [Prescottella equi]YP_005087091.1 hypothetical protein RoPhREQ2_gp47 [Rhodococcus phage REQ2]AEV51901.1 hypothetical protein [Rhodococcus phage REQ2]